MSECPFQSRLSAFHDHELDAETAEKLESHLAGCPACNEQLLGIRAVSRLFREAPSGRMSQFGVSRLHAVAETAAKRRDVFPMFKMLTAVAASIFVIAGAWLVESPGQTQGTHPVVLDPMVDAPIWEKLATGGRLELPREMGQPSDVAKGPDSQDRSRLHFQDWMIESLKQDSGS
jgi:anti-sigma factor RsiW